MNSDAMNSNADDIGVVDKRTQRRMDGLDYTKGIIKFRESIISTIPPAPPEGSPGSPAVLSSSPASVPASSSVKVVIRKRPLFPHEEQKGEFDVITRDPASSGMQGMQAMYITLCGEKIRARRGVTKIITNVKYPCHQAFDETHSNADLYNGVAKPILEHACKGSTGTIFMFGQTGSGKTFTMSSIQEQIALDIFAAANGQPITLIYFELKGSNTVTDLLDPAKSALKLLASSDESTVVSGATTITVTSADQLMSHISDAIARRETDATQANATSSRSHAICTLSIGSTGILTLVDLAGSERKEDSMYHDATKRKEGAEINASLHALKECIRMRAIQQNQSAAEKSSKHVHIPYRGHNLTKVLKNSFSDRDAMTVVIATTSPGVSDTEHSMSTLDTVCMISGSEAVDKTADVREVEDWKPDVEEVVHVKLWTAEAVDAWVRKTKGGQFGDIKLQSGMDGKALLRLNSQRLQGCFGNHRDAKSLGDNLFKAIREEVARCDAIDKKRRDMIIGVANEKKSMASVYSKALAPVNPNMRS
jgi:kinesin family protein 2/24